MISVLNVAVVGVSVMGRSIYPVLTSISYINVANFIQRLDTFMVLYILCGSFMKFTVYAFCAISGAADLFHVKQTTKLIFPISMIILIVLLLNATSIIELQKEGYEVLPILIHLPLQIALPSCLLLINVIQRNRPSK